MWVLIDPVMGASYNRNSGLTLDVKLALLSDAELIGFTGASKSKRVATQTHVLALETRSYSDPRLN